MSEFTTASKLALAIQEGGAALAGYPLVGGLTSVTLEATTKALAGLLDALVGVPGSSGHKIDEMWAWVAFDPEDGNEGIPAFAAAGGLMLPMVGADWDMVRSLRSLAQDAANLSGRPITLRRFSQMTVVDTLEPVAA